MLAASSPLWFLFVNPPPPPPPQDNHGMGYNVAPYPHAYHPIMQQNQQQQQQMVYPQNPNPFMNNQHPNHNYSNKYKYRALIRGLVWRGFKIFSTSFLMSELLARLGVFGMDGDSKPLDFGKFAKDQIKRLENFQNRVVEIWNKSRDEYLNEKTFRAVLEWVDKKWTNFPQDVIAPGIKSYRSLPNKTKFATGTSFGMLWSRLMLRISWKVTKLCGAVYLTNELLHYLNILGSEDAFLNKIWTSHLLAEQQQSIIQAVELARRSIANSLHTISYKFQHFMAALMEEETATAVGMVGGTMIGFIVM